MTDRSHKARAALEDVPKLIEQFRQSVLAAAFRGDLTADWREKNPDIEPASELLERIKVEKDLADSKSSRRSPSKPQDLEMPDFQIPESWEKVLSHDLLAFVTSGSRGWMVSALIGSGKLSLPGWEPYVSSKATQAQSFERRWRRFLTNKKINIEHIYLPLVMAALSKWKNQRLSLAIDTTVLWESKNYF